MQLKLYLEHPDSLPVHFGYRFVWVSLVPMRHESTPILRVDFVVREQACDSLPGVDVQFNSIFREVIRHDFVSYGSVHVRQFGSTAYNLNVFI